MQKKIKKKYSLGELKIDNECKTVFIEEDGGPKQYIITQDNIIEILNNYSKESDELRLLRHKNSSLQERLHKQEVRMKELQSKEPDYDNLKKVCKIIQSRIDFCSGECVLINVTEHLKNVKREIKKEGLWRE